MLLQYFVFFYFLYLFFVSCFVVQNERFGTSFKNIFSQWVQQWEIGDKKVEITCTHLL